MANHQNTQDKYDLVPDSHLRDPDTQQTDPFTSPQPTPNMTSKPLKSLHSPQGSYGERGSVAGSVSQRQRAMTEAVPQGPRRQLVIPPPYGPIYEDSVPVSPRATTPVTPEIPRKQLEIQSPKGLTHKDLIPLSSTSFATQGFGPRNALSTPQVISTAQDRNSYGIPVFEAAAVGRKGIKLDDAITYLFNTTSLKPDHPLMQELDNFKREREARTDFWSKRKERAGLAWSYADQQRCEYEKARAHDDFQSLINRFAAEHKKSARNIHDHENQKITKSRLRRLRRESQAAQLTRQLERKKAQDASLYIMEGLMREQDLNDNTIPQSEGNKEPGEVDRELRNEIRNTGRDPYGDPSSRIHSRQKDETVKQRDTTFHAVKMANEMGLRKKIEYLKRELGKVSDSSVQSNSRSKKQKRKDRSKQMLNRHLPIRSREPGNIDTPLHGRDSQLQGPPPSKRNNDADLINPRGKRRRVDVDSGNKISDGGRVQDLDTGSMTSQRQQWESNHPLPLRQHTERRSDSTVALPHDKLSRTDSELGKEALHDDRFRNLSIRLRRNESYQEHEDSHISHAQPLERGNDTWVIFPRDKLLNTDDYLRIKDQVQLGSFDRDFESQETIERRRRNEVEHEEPSLRTSSVISQGGTASDNLPPRLPSTTNPFHQGASFGDTTADRSVHERGQQTTAPVTNFRETVRPTEPSAPDEGHDTSAPDHRAGYSPVPDASSAHSRQHTPEGSDRDISQNPVFSPERFPAPSRNSGARKQPDRAPSTVAPHAGSMLDADSGVSAEQNFLDVLLDELEERQRSLAHSSETRQSR